MLAYIQSHPELVALIFWPAFTAACSFFDAFLSQRYPRLFAYLMSSGFDAKSLAKLVLEELGLTRV